MPVSVDPIVRRAAASTVTMLGNRVEILLAAGDTGGTQALVDYSATPGFVGPPLHRHDFDETFYVLDGAPLFRVGAETVRGEPGTVVFVPRGVAHTFANPGPAPARIVIGMSPGGFERYFGELAALVESSGGAPDREAVGALGRAYGVEIVAEPG